MSSFRGFSWFRNTIRRLRSRAVLAASLEIRFEQMENMVLLCREAWLA
jgi:hypothetical protein